MIILSEPYVGLSLSDECAKQEPAQTIGPLRLVFFGMVITRKHLFNEVSDGAKWAPGYQLIDSSNCYVAHGVSRRSDDSSQLMRQLRSGQLCLVCRPLNNNN